MLGPKQTSRVIKMTIRQREGYSSATVWNVYTPCIPGVHWSVLRYDRRSNENSSHVKEFESRSLLISTTRSAFRRRLPLILWYREWVWNEAHLGVMLSCGLSVMAVDRERVTETQKTRIALAQFVIPSQLVRRGRESCLVLVSTSTIAGYEGIES